MDHRDDEALLDEFRQNRDPALFKSLLRRFQNRLFNTAYRILGNAEEAEEVVQDTCIKVYQGIDKFNKNSSFAAWIFRIAHNSCLDVVRIKQRKRNIQFVPLDAPADPEGGSESPGAVAQAADPSPGPADLLDHSEQGAVIAEKLAMLPDSQRTVLVLHDIEGFSYIEISEITGEAVGTVRSRLHYGRQKMRELLEPYYSSGAVSRAQR